MIGCPKQRRSNLLSLRVQHGTDESMVCLAQGAFNRDNSNPGTALSAFLLRLFSAGCTVFLDLKQSHHPALEISCAFGPSIYSCVLVICGDAQ